MVVSVVDGIQSIDEGIERALSFYIAMLLISHNDLKIRQDIRVARVDDHPFETAPVSSLHNVTIARELPKPNKFVRQGLEPIILQVAVRTFEIFESSSSFPDRI
jgi:hypothetical protein